MNSIKLFIIDDSAIVRQTISHLVKDESDIELIGVAADPLYAMEKFKTTGLPDVLILDIEMPRMDGVTFLKQIMKEQPIATIICSSFAKLGSSVVDDIRRAGAVAVIEKPNLQTKQFLEKSKESLLNSIRVAAKSSFNKKRVVAKPMGNAKKVIAIGSSTGGVQVLEKILKALPSGMAPILITQHMPAGFTASLAKRLNTLCRLRVKQAEDGDVLEQSTVYIAQGDKHMTIEKSALKYIIRIKDGPKVSHHRPSVDVLFRSFAQELGSSGVGIILTGMGSDGARGMKAMFDLGAKTYAQDEESCVVYGMPNEAVKQGGVTNSLSIQKIIELIQSIR